MGSNSRKMEKILTEALKSESASKIYLAVYKRGGLRSSEIATITGLHPSTVRECLARLCKQRVLYREKIKEKTVGKNPYIYFAASPLKILKIYIKKVENDLNHLAKLVKMKVKISLKEEKEC